MLANRDPGKPQVVCGGLGAIVRAFASNGHTKHVADESIEYVCVGGGCDGLAGAGGSRDVSLRFHGRSGVATKFGCASAIVREFFSKHVAVDQIVSVCAGRGCDGLADAGGSRGVLLRFHKRSSVAT